MSRGQEAIERNAGAARRHTGKGSGRRGTETGSTRPHTEQVHTPSRTRNRGEEASQRPPHSCGSSGAEGTRGRHTIRRDRTKMLSHPTSHLPLIGPPDKIRFNDRDKPLPRNSGTQKVDHSHTFWAVQYTFRLTIWRICPPFSPNLLRFRGLGWHNGCQISVGGRGSITLGRALPTAHRDHLQRLALQHNLAPQPGPTTWPHRSTVWRSPTSPISRQDTVRSEFSERAGLHAAATVIERRMQGFPSAQPYLSVVSPG